MSGRMKFGLAVCPEAGMSEPVLLRGDVLKAAKKAKAMGYDAVEIHLRDTSQVDFKALQAWCEQNDFGVCALATGQIKRLDGLSFVDADAGVRGRAVARVKQYIDEAAPFGAAVIIGSLRGALPDGEDPAPVLARLDDCLRTLAAYAGNKGVNLVHEVINRYENNYLNTADEMMAYLEALGCENVLCHLDSFHMNIEERDTDEAVARCGEKLGYIHLADNTRHAVGEGCYDFARLIAAAERAGYTGYLSLECLPLPSGEAAAQKSIQALDRLYTR